MSISDLDLIRDLPDDLPWTEARKIMAERKAQTTTATVDTTPNTVDVALQRMTDHLDRVIARWDTDLRDIERTVRRSCTEPMPTTTVPMAAAIVALGRLFEAVSESRARSAGLGLTSEEEDVLRDQIYSAGRALLDLDEVAFLRCVEAGVYVPYEPGQHGCGGPLPCACAANNDPWIG